MKKITEINSGYLVLKNLDLESSRWTSKSDTNIPTSSRIVSIFFVESERRKELHIFLGSRRLIKIDYTTHSVINISPLCQNTIAAYYKTVKKPIPDIFASN